MAVCVHVCMWGWEAGAGKGMGSREGVGREGSGGWIPVGLECREKKSKHQQLAKAIELILVSVSASEACAGIGC